MINNMNYNQVLEVSRVLKENADIIEQLIKDKDLQELQDFISTVEGYSKFLETTVELHKDADLALADLAKQKK